MRPRRDCPPNAHSLQLNNDHRLVGPPSVQRPVVSLHDPGSQLVDADGEDWLVFGWALLLSADLRRLTHRYGEVHWQVFTSICFGVMRRDPLPSTALAGAGSRP
jgi:hypothetical protein